MAAFSITNRVHQADQSMSIRVISLLIGGIASVMAVHGSVPIIVSGGGGRRAAMNLCNKAEDQLKNGDVTGAKGNVETALHSDPKFWPALYIRAKIFVRQGQYQLAIADCNEALRQYPGFVEASLLRAGINAHLGKYSEALKETNYLISMHPRRVTLGRALKHRAWIQATCPDPAFRNGQQAVKDAKAACSISEWKDENTIDTLAAAYAETGDFDSATRYAAQALTIKGIAPVDSKRIHQHLALFERHQPVRL
jgi:tetratricopeptide (TPR) repeat protein